MYFWRLRDTFCLSPFPPHPPLYPSSNKFQKLSFLYYLQKKVIETTKKCDCDRKRLLKRLGRFKSLKTSQGRQVVNTLKYTFFSFSLQNRGRRRSS